MLREILEDAESLQARIEDTNEYIEQQSITTEDDLDTISTLTETLEKRKSELKIVEEQIEMNQRLLQQGRERVNGLAIRSLSMHLLSIVFSFLDLNGGINRVCKYWSLIASNIRQGIEIKRTNTSNSRANKSKKPVALDVATSSSTVGLITSSGSTPTNSLLLMSQQNIHSPKVQPSPAASAVSKELFSVEHVPRLT